MSPSDDIPAEVRALARKIAADGYPHIDLRLRVQHDIEQAIMADRRARTPDAGVLREALSELRRIAARLGEPSDPFAAWEKLEALIRALAFYANPRAHHYSLSIPEAEHEFPGVKLAVMVHKPGLYKIEAEAGFVIPPAISDDGKVAHDTLAGLGTDPLVPVTSPAALSASTEPDATPLNISAEHVSKAAKIEHEPDAGVADMVLVPREDRQQQVADWCAAAFGADHQSSVPQRGLRFLEEAIEAYQALGGDPAVAHKLIDYIFAKEPGKLFQELGGVGVTLLALAAAAGMSADEAEKVEIARVLSKPLEHFWARNKVKNDAGFDATAYPSVAPNKGQSNAQ